MLSSNYLIENVFQNSKLCKRRLSMPPDSLFRDIITLDFAESRNPLPRSRDSPSPFSPTPTKRRAMPSDAERCRAMPSKGEPQTGLNALLVRFRTATTPKGERCQTKADKGGRTRTIRDFLHAFWVGRGVPPRRRRLFDLFARSYAIKQ